MKTFTIFMMVLTIALAGVMGYALFNTALVVEGQGLREISASEREGEFSVLQTALDRGNLEGTIFDQNSFLDISQHQFHVYTLRLKNPCLIPAKMVEIQISPVAGDVLCYDEKTQVDIPAGDTRDVWAVLLTKNETPAVREMTVTYYLWGNPQTVKYTYEPA